jgi:hypothetical protein
MGSCARYVRALLPYLRLARLTISAQVLITTRLSTIDWLKLKPFKLNAIVEIPKAVNQIPTTGQAAKKKCKERELLKLVLEN